MISFITRHKVIISIATFSIIYLYTLDNYWKPVWDSAIYISLGKSIAAGNGYYYMGLPHSKYPFILPLMLSPIIGLFGLNFLLMRLLIIIFTIGAIYLTYILFKKFTDEGTAFSIMILTGFSSTLLHLSTWILSEIPYMFFSLCTLYCIIVYGEEKKCFTRTGFLLSISLVTVIFTRMIGAILLITFLCHFLLNRGVQGHLTNKAKKVMIIITIVSIPLCFWFYRSHLINKNIPFQPEYRGVMSYEKEFFLKVPDNIHSESISFGDFIKRIKINSRTYVQSIPNFIAKKVPFKKIRLLIVLLLLCGFCWCLVKRRTVIEYYLSFYLIVCIIFWVTTERYLMSVIPFLFYYFLTSLKIGIELLFRMIAKGESNKTKIVKRFILGLVVIFLVSINFSFKPSVIKGERRKQFHPPALISEFFSAIEWIKESTPQDSIIMSNRAPWVFMLTDRITLTYPLFEPLSYVVNSIFRNRVDYIVVSNIRHETYHLLHDFAESHPKQFIQVFRNNKTSIYKIERENFSILEKEVEKNGGSKT